MHSCSCTTEDCRVCPSEVICRCLRVTEEEVVIAIRTLEVRTIREIRQTTGAGDGCTACHRKLKALIEQHTPSEKKELALVA